MVKGLEVQVREPPFHAFAAPAQLSPAAAAAAATAVCRSGQYVVNDWS